MSDKKISELTELPEGEINNNDVLPILDVSDTTDSENGTTKGVSFATIVDFFQNIFVGGPGGSVGSIQYNQSGTIIGGANRAFVDNSTDRVGFGVDDIDDLEGAVVTIKQPAPEEEQIALAVLNSEGDSVLEIDNGHLRPTTAHFEQIAVEAAEGAATIDWTRSNKQLLVLSEETTVTFVDPLGAASLLLLIIASGNEITWPESVYWPGGVPPTLSADNPDIVSLYFMPDFGGSYLGTYSLDLSLPA